MKKKVVYGLLLSGVMMFCVGGCGKDEVVQNTTDVVEYTEPEEPEVITKPSEDKWLGEQSRPSKSEESTQTEGQIVSTESSETEEPTEPSETVEPTESSEAEDTTETTEHSETEDTTETIEPSEAEDTTETTEQTETESPIITEDDLVRVVVPELNKEYQDYVYNSLATYRVEGNVTINDSIDYGVTLESDDIKKLITLIYEGTGCTSHKVVEETFAIYDTDPYDYSAYIELSDGTKYALYLVNDTCYAIADTY